MFKLTKEGVDFYRAASARNPLRLFLDKAVKSPDMVVVESDVPEEEEGLLSRALSMGYLLSSVGVTAKDWRRITNSSKRALSKAKSPEVKQDLVWGNLPENRPYLTKVSAITERSKYIRVQFTVLEPLSYLGERLYRDYYPRRGGMEYWEHFLKAFGFELIDWPGCKSRIIGQGCVSISASRDNPVFTGRYGTHLRTETRSYWDGSGGRITWSG